MNSVSRLLAAPAIALTLTSTTMAQDATFTVLPGVLSANDMTPDGRVVVGALGDFFSAGAYYWTKEAGVVAIGGIEAFAVSDDGSVIFGQIDDPEGSGTTIAGIWSAADGWQSIGSLPGASAFCGGGVSSAYELSAGGTVATGLAWRNGCDAVGFRWTAETGMLALESLANGNNRSSVLSADGSIMGGFAQGSFSRTPAVWYADGTGELLDPPDGDVLGEVHGITDDGQTLLGAWNDDAFKWTVGEGIETFGSFIGGEFSGIATDMDDAGTIVGFDILLTARYAWIRPADGELINLPAYLIQQGIDNAPAVIEVAQAISTDGRVICGHSHGQGGWIVDLGGACPGDIDESGAVEVNDLLQVIGAWGACDGLGQLECPEDVNGDLVVDVNDLLIILGGWGACP